MAQFTTITTFEFDDSAEKIAGLRKTLARRLRRPVSDLPTDPIHLLTLVSLSSSALQLTIGMKTLTSEVERNDPVTKPIA